MHDFVLILTPLLFCLMTGYLMSLAQRGLTILERIEEKLSNPLYARQIEPPAQAPKVTGDPAQDLIAAGMYTWGPKGKDGMQELIPLIRK